MKFSKNVNNKKHTPKLIFFKEKNFRKIRIIFDIENWLWKSEIGIFGSLDLEQVLIWQCFFYEQVLFFTKLSFHLMRKLMKIFLILSKVQASNKKKHQYFNVELKEKVPKMQLLWLQHRFEIEIPRPYQKLKEIKGETLKSQQRNVF